MLCKLSNNSILALQLHVVVQHMGEYLREGRKIDEIDNQIDAHCAKKWDARLHGVLVVVAYRRPCMTTPALKEQFSIPTLNVADSCSSDLSPQVSGQNLMMKAILQLPHSVLWSSNISWLTSWSSLSYVQVTHLWNTSKKLPIMTLCCLDSLKAACSIDLEFLTAVFNRFMMVKIPTGLRSSSRPQCSCGPRYG